MTTSPYISDIHGLNALLDRYFDGTESTADIRWLRSLIDGSELPDIAIDAATARRLQQALVVMCAAGAAIATEASKPAEAPRSDRRSRMLRIAASAAVVVTVGIAALNLGHASAADRCTAYVGGKRIDNSEQVLAMMRTQLSEAGEAAETAETAEFGGLDDIRHAMQEIDSEN